MKIAYFDAFAGCAGDMILGAFLDAGYPIEKLRRGLEGLGVGGFELDSERVLRNEISGTKLTVRITEEQPHRHLEDLVRLIDQGTLPSRVKERSIAAFERLVEVEAGIHGQRPEEVHLHEVGAVDAIVDVVGTFLAVEESGIDRVISSPLPQGRGFVECAHGVIPVPAPATVRLLENVPIQGVLEEGETVTPTGALLVTELAESFGPIPSMILKRVGYGAGSREHGTRPNLFRLLLGEHQSDPGGQVCGAVVLETNVDDMNPELFGYLAERLWAAGALDVGFIPIQMKKGRPGTMIHVICSPENQGLLEEILLRESTTAGVRAHKVERRVLEREVTTVQTRFGKIRVKISRLGPDMVKAAPEYDDCRLRALEHRTPLREVYLAALRALETKERERKIVPADPPEA